MCDRLVHVLNVERLEMNQRKRFKELGGEVGYKVAKALVKGELKIGDISKRTRLKQPSISYTVAKMEKLGLITKRREWKEVFCSLTQTARDLLSVN